jgi:hypothetical protein
VPVLDLIHVNKWGKAAPSGAMISTITLVAGLLDVRNGHVDGRSRAAVANSRAIVSGTMAEPIGVRRFLGDLEFLGPCRFIVQGQGAILEAVGAFDDLRLSETPKGSSLATVSVDDTFECHINLDKVQAAAFVTKSSANGGKQLYLVRLLDAEDTSLLSVMLHASADGYEEGAVEFWTQLRDRFGDKVDLTAAEKMEGAA